MDDVCFLDASVFLDIISIDILHIFFSEFTNVQIPDVVYAEISNETQQLQIDRYKNSYLIIPFSPAELQNIQSISHLYSGLSFADCSLIFLAQKEDRLLLTSDRALRKVAGKYGIEVHGIVWILETLIRTRGITKVQAIEKAKAIIRINPRAPQEVLEERIRMWENKGW